MGLRVPDRGHSSQKIGDFLVELGFISEADLKRTLETLSPSGLRLGAQLVAYGLITEKQLALGLCAQFKMEFVELEGLVPTSDAVVCVPEKVARENTILPLSIEDQVLTIALFDPASIVGLQSIKWKKKYKVVFKIAAHAQIKKAIDSAYKKGDRVQAIVKELMTKDEPRGVTTLSTANKATMIVHDPVDGNVGSIEALVDKLIENAIINGASDIHVEPDEQFIRVRERIDGVLHEVNSIPLELGPALVSRIKILANLDFAEKRNSQDGRIRVSIGTRTIDLRISTLPTVRGEKIVLRILDKQAFNVELSAIGFPEPELKKLKHVLDSPFGIIFVTGPTGSGKSTTVYSMLGQLNAIEKNIITIEDPVEYQFSGINQVQVQPKIGFTFANILRGVLRQDPDIIMVGEIRDKETAEIAIRAALTGHLVITTLHTNNAVSTISRLIDMGIEPALISGSLLGVVSQRLVRKLCLDCRKLGKISEIDLVRLASPRLNAETQVYHPVGCHKCRNQGFKGRTPISELLAPDAVIRKAIISRGSEDIIIDHLKSVESFRVMREDGIDKIIAGITTPTEILKATLAED